jgi:excisionase family DNA binding protein
MADQLNVRIPPITDVQIVDLMQWTGMTQTQIVTQAIDRLHQETKKSREADELPIIVQTDGKGVEAVNIRYAASYLDSSIRDLYKLIQEGNLTAYKQGKEYYLPRDEVEKLKQTGQSAE